MSPAAKKPARLAAGQVPKTVALGKDQWDKERRGRLWLFKAAEKNLAVLDMPRPAPGQLVLSLEDARELGRALLNLCESVGG